MPAAEITDWEPTTGGVLVLFNNGTSYPLTAARMLELHRIETAVRSPLAAAFYQLHLMLSGGDPGDPDMGQPPVEAVTPKRLKNGAADKPTSRLLNLFADTYKQLCDNHADRRRLHIPPSAPHRTLEAARGGTPAEPPTRGRHDPHAAARDALRRRTERPTQ